MVRNKFLRKLLNHTNYQHLNIRIRYTDFKAANTYNLYLKIFPSPSPPICFPTLEEKVDRWKDRSFKCYVGNVSLGEKER